MKLIARIAIALFLAYCFCSCSSSKLHSGAYKYSYAKLYSLGYKCKPFSGHVIIHRTSDSTKSNLITHDRP